MFRVALVALALLAPASVANAGTSDWAKVCSKANDRSADCSQRVDACVHQAAERSNRLSGTVTTAIFIECQEQLFPNADPSIFEAD